MTRTPAASRLRTFPRTPRACRHAKNIPAQQAAPQAYARIPCAHGHEERPQGVECPAGERPGAPLSVSAAPRGAFRFQRESRVAAQHEFNEVFSRASRSSDAHFTVLACANARENARLGLAISRKAARRATDRNRLKRHAREVFRHLRADLGGLDLVVMARPAAASASGAELRSSLERLYRAMPERCAN